MNNQQRDRHSSKSGVMCLNCCDKKPRDPRKGYRDHMVYKVEGKGFYCENANEFFPDPEGNFHQAAVELMNEQEFKREFPHAKIPK
jgi:hypothetical protein